VGFAGLRLGVGLGSPLTVAGERLRSNLLHHGKLQPSLYFIHAIQHHAHAVAHRVTPAGALADNLAHALAIREVVPLKAGDGNKAFDKKAVELDEAAILGDAHDHGVKFFAQALKHEFDFLPLHQLALGVVGPPFRLAGLVGDAG
jgi:hypothetical protein